MSRLRECFTEPDYCKIRQHVGADHVIPPREEVAELVLACFDAEPGELAEMIDNEPAEFASIARDVAWLALAATGVDLAKLHDLPNSKSASQAVLQQVRELEALEG